METRDAAPAARRATAAEVCGAEVCERRLKSDADSDNIRNLKTAPRRGGRAPGTSTCVCGGAARPRGRRAAGRGDVTYLGLSHSLRSAGAARAAHQPNHHAPCIQ